MVSRNVDKERAHSQTSPWKAWQPFFKSFDFVMGNFEGAIGKPSQCLVNPKGPCFAVSEKWTTDFQEAGFHAMSLANNHSMDLGPEGIEQTHQALLKAGISPMDFQNAPFFQTVNGHHLAILPISLIPGKDGVVQDVPSIPVLQRLRLAKNFSDWVIVFIHWGIELQDWPDESQIKAAHWLVRHGADLIIGMHPHVIQKPECVEGKPVFYSLGNHLFDQKYAATKSGLMANCELNDVGLTCKTQMTRTPMESFYPRMGEDSIQWQMQSSVCAGYTSSKTKGRDRMDTLPPHRPFISAERFHSKHDSIQTLYFALENQYSTLDHEKGIRPYVYSIHSNRLISRWRGSGLAWPLIDATFLSDSQSVLCALHRGDSFLIPDAKTTARRIAAYEWNGFGFSMLRDALIQNQCSQIWR